MKAWLRDHKELLINAALAGLYVGITTFAATKDAGAVAALIGAAAAAARFVIGYVAKHVSGVPTIVVDE